MQIKSMNSHQQISQRPHKNHENPARKAHTTNMQHKAWHRTRVRQEKEAEFIQQSKSIKYHQDISLEYHRLSQTTYVLTMGHGGEYTQSPAFFNTTSLPSLHHIITTNPEPPTEPSNYNSMSARHVKSFSTIRVDLLAFISVTLATSHWLRSPSKAEAPANTVARKEGRLHSQSTRKKTKAEGRTLTKIFQQPKEGKQHSSKYIHTSLHQPKPPRVNLLESQEHICSGHVTSSSNIHTYRLDVMHAGDTNPTTSTQNPSVSQRTRTCT
jgi:hypothetical protein